MNGLMIGVVAFLLLMTVAGMYNGLIRCIFGMAALILSVVVSFVLTKVLSGTIVKGGFAEAICFIVVFLMVYIACIVVMISLNLLASLPVLSTLNRIGGAVLGAVLGLLCVWIFMAVITVLAENGTGVQILEMIKESELLMGLYENNFIDLLFQEHLWNRIDLKK